MRRISAFLLLAVVVLLAPPLAPPALAQRIAGDIVGTITDENGAVLAGATVTATCTSTGLVRVTKSTDAGAYRLADLPICVYKVSVTTEGFKTVNRQVEAAVSSTTKADFRLQLGQRSEELTVEAAAPVIEYSDKLNSYVDADRINNMPINGRDFNALLGVVPGVQRTPGGGFLSISITGQRATSNNFMVDGISNNDRYYGGIAMGEAGIGGTPATIIPADAIAEFTVQQTPGVEFGVKGGAAINIVMKSGTNEFHGSGSYFLGKDSFDSKNFFTAKANQDKPPFKNQQFGGTFGGPIVKDKTFFFAYYEGQRETVGTPYQEFVPSTDQIAQARARIAAAGLKTNPAGEALLKFWPTDPSGVITVAAPNTNNSDTFSLKIDHKVNDTNQLSLRGMYGKGYQNSPAFAGEIVPQAPYSPDMFNSVTSPKVTLAGITWTSTLSSNKVLEARVGYSRFSQTLDINNKIDPKSLGIDTGPLDSRDFGVPVVYYLGYFGSIGGILGYPLTTAPNANLDVSSTFTWITGKHTLKFGGNFQRATTYSLRNRARTELDFTGGTFDPIDSLVALLLGRSDDAIRSFGSTERNLSQNSYGIYVADDWKVSPRFTVNLGLRYDISTPLSEQNNLAANFFPDRGLVSVGQGISQLYNTDTNNFGPRVGFAWDITGDAKTALRGGYALSYDVANFAAIHAPYSVNGARVGAFTQISQGVFGVVLNGDLAVLPDDPTASCVDPNTGVGNYVCINPNGSIYGPSPNGQPPFNAFSIKQDLQTPMFHLFHLSFQREIFKNNTVTLSYVGQRGKDLLMVRDLNAPPIGSDYTNPGPNRPFAQQFPNLKHIVQLNNDGRSWYDSLQFSYRQKDWHGFNTQYNLTWSHCLDYNSVNRGGSGQAGQFQNPYNPAGNKGDCDYDVPLNFNAGGNYRFPTIKGLGRMGEGWMLSTIFTALSGRPWTATVQRDQSGQNFDYVRANCSGQIQYNTSNPDAFISNPQIFSAPPPGTVGTCGRNTIRGPGLAQWDLVLVKNTQITDKTSLQFRLEGFNILNRANFGPNFNSTNPLSKSFGTIGNTPDVYAINPIISQGGPRAFQFAFKLLF